METGIELIAIERKEQKEKHGFTPARDNAIYKDGTELLNAAACYLANGQALTVGVGNKANPQILELWPWSRLWWKPSKNNPIPDLAKAGALIAAMIDMLIDRKEKTAEKSLKSVHLFEKRNQIK
jgi:hypothetical protein